MKEITKEQVDGLALGREELPVGRTVADTLISMKTARGTGAVSRSRRSPVSADSPASARS